MVLAAAGFFIVRVRRLGGGAQVVRVHTIMDDRASAGVRGPGDHRPRGACRFHSRSICNPDHFLPAMFWPAVARCAALSCELSYGTGRLGSGAFALAGNRHKVVSCAWLQVLKVDAVDLGSAVIVIRIG